MLKIIFGAIIGVVLCFVVLCFVGAYKANLQLEKKVKELEAEVEKLTKEKETDGECC